MASIRNELTIPFLRVNVECGCLFSENVFIGGMWLFFPLVIAQTCSVPAGGRWCFQLWTVAAVHQRRVAKLRAASPCGTISAPSGEFHTSPSPTLPA